MTRPLCILALVLAWLVGPTLSSQAEISFSTIDEPSMVLHMARVAPGAGRVEVLAAYGAETGAEDAGMFLLEFAKFSGASLILSGGYLAEFTPVRALGMVRTDGRDLNPMHRSWLTTGLFCTDGARWLIAPITSTAWQGFPDCLQAGPMLVVDGRVRYGAERIEAAEMKLANSTQPHPFLCVLNDGALVLGLSERTDLKRLGDVLQQRIGCRSAMRLSGGVTGGMWSSQQGQRGSGSVRLHNAIGVFPN